MDVKTAESMDIETTDTPIQRAARRSGLRRQRSREPAAASAAASSAAATADIGAGAAVVAGASVRHTVRTDVPEFVVNLDLPAGERWTHILPQFKHLIGPVLDFAAELVGTGMVAKGIKYMLGLVCRMGGMHNRDELMSVAKLLGIKLGEVVMVHIAYEVMTACTSIVVNGSEGFPLHIRTMDWDMECLEPLTIQVSFQRGGRTLFKASTWAGMVGVATGMRIGPDGYSVSLNYRRTHADVSVQGVIMNILSGWLARSWPAMFLIRAVLEDTPGFPQALSELAHSKLMAPCYIIVAGTQRGQGAILSRSRGETLHPWTLQDHGDCVQVNIDHWKGDGGAPLDADICESLARRKQSREILRRLKAENAVTMQNLWTLVALPPMLAHDTVYTVSMSPATGEYTTVVTAPTAIRREAKRKWGSVAEQLAMLDFIVDQTCSGTDFLSVEEFLGVQAQEIQQDRSCSRRRKTRLLRILHSISAADVRRHALLYPPNTHTAEAANRM